MQLFLYIFTFWIFQPTTISSTKTDNYLSVTISGIQEDKGQIRIGLFKNAVSFPKQGKQHKGYLIDVKDKKASIKIYNIQKGTYAIGVMHDVNKNEKLDKNWLGYPIELYGFSNDARATFSAPSFESASFYHDGSTAMTIKVL